MNPSAILCADWGADQRKRAVYVADSSSRVVRRLPRAEWSLKSVLKAAAPWLPTAPVLVTFDTPLGVPASHMSALYGPGDGGRSGTFLDLVSRMSSIPRFYAPTSEPSEWHPERPFFAVPPRQGGLGEYVSAAAQFGVELKRDIDRVTAAKPVFVKSGIPGSVGSAAISLWRELAEQLAPERAFKVWPFEETLDQLLQVKQLIVAEIYPRAAYATALWDGSVDSRAPLVVAKTEAAVRARAIEVLEKATWVRQHGVTLQDLGHALSNEDDFDACVTAAALLRCVLEGLPLCPPTLNEPLVEGGMLGTGSVNLRLQSRAFSPLGRSDRTSRESAQGVSRRQPSAPKTQSGERVHVCPIPGCSKRFTGSRGGWDAHVGAARLHPGWHSDVRDPEARKRAFRAEFPEFFG